MLVSERCFKAKVTVLLLFSVFIVFMTSDFAIWHIKIICMSEKALPED